MASCPVPTLDSLESFIRDKILKDKYTHKQVRDFLLKKFPGARGFSIRSIERFCSARGIHRTARLCDSALDEAVSTAVKKVRKAVQFLFCLPTPLSRARALNDTISRNARSARSYFWYIYGGVLSH